MGWEYAEMQYRCVDRILSMGVKFDVRGVPADSPANIDDLIKLAEKKLAEKN